MITWRDYQSEAIDKVFTGWEKYQHMLGVAATGGGKTAVFWGIVDRFLELFPNARVLIAAHREELISQPFDRVNQFFPHLRNKVGIVMGDADAPHKQIVIATIQTIGGRSGRRLSNMLKYGKIDLLIIDEAHHAEAPQYYNVFRVLLEKNPLLKTLGVTATPERGDRKLLTKIFEHEVFNIPIRRLIDEGHLCEPIFHGIKTKVDLDSVRVNGKGGKRDYKTDDLVNAFETEDVFKLVVETHMQHCNHRPTVAFTVSVKGAKRLAEMMNNRGVKAVAIYGDMSKEDRRDAIDGMKSGKYTFLSNCLVATEGFDLPKLECLHMVRPTKSDALYIQCLDTETEVLTLDGWARYTDVSTGDMVAGYDIDTKEIRWVPVREKFVRFVGEGESMIEYDSPTLNFRVTDGHRMIRESKIKKNRGFVTAGVLAHYASGTYLPIAGYEKAEGVPLTDDEIRFVGWFVTDGTRDYKTNRITICQSEHQQYNQDIVKCLEGCGFKYSISRSEYGEGNLYKANSASLRYNISHGNPRGTNKDLRGWADLEDYLDKNLSLSMENLDRRQLGVFLEAVHLGDGHKQNGQSWTQRSYHISTGNLLFAERLQSLCVRRGYKCNISTLYYNTNPLYILHIKDTDRRFVAGQDLPNRQHITANEPKPNEIVWCVQNDLGTLVTRRRGQVLIMGNCVGRVLRLSPETGKNHADIFDYLPMDNRNFEQRMQIYKKPKRPRESPEEPIARGEGPPKPKSTGEIEMVILDYFNRREEAWLQTTEGWRCIQLGKGVDPKSRRQVERGLALSPDGMQLWAIWRFVGDKQFGIRGDRWAKAKIIGDGDAHQNLQMIDTFTQEYGNRIIMSRSAEWRNREPSPGFMQWGRSMQVYQEGMKQGELSDAINEKLILDAVRRGMKEASKLEREKALEF
jgi:superfamily II DNA or RNA helicase